MICSTLVNDMARKIEVRHHGLDIQNPGIKIQYGIFEIQRPDATWVDANLFHRAVL